jgi:hypothetical protein
LVCFVAGLSFGLRRLIFLSLIFFPLTACRCVSLGFVFLQVFSVGRG